MPGLEARLDGRLYVLATGSLAVLAASAVVQVRSGPSPMTHGGALTTMINPDVGLDSAVRMGLVPGAAVSQLGVATSRVSEIPSLRLLVGALGPSSSGPRVRRPWREGRNITPR